MSKLKIGVVGCGGIANQKHFPAMKANSDLCEIVAFCDIIKERAEKGAAEYGAEGARIYEDYHDLLADSEVMGRRSGGGLCQSDRVGFWAEPDISRAYRGGLGNFSA